jgi:hypothetical protein
VKPFSETCIEIAYFIKDVEFFMFTGSQPNDLCVCTSNYSISQPKYKYGKESLFIK